jgi:hypothetical protein
VIAERETLRYFATEIVGLELHPGQERFVSLIDGSFEELRLVVVRKGRRVGRDEQDQRLPRGDHEATRGGLGKRGTGVG